MTCMGGLVGGLIARAAVGGGEDPRRRRRNQNRAGTDQPMARLASGWRPYLVFGAVGGLLGFVGFPLLRFVGSRLGARSREQTLAQQFVDLVLVLVAGAFVLIAIAAGFIGFFQLSATLLE